MVKIMIKISDIETYGWETAIRGMRNPMNSWDNSDSAWFIEWGNPKFNIGKNDLSLMKKLASAGNDHGKFMRMITVTMDIEAPLYWWKEFDTYKVGTVANSCSTMHKIQEKEFTLDDFSHEHLTHTDAFHMDANEDALNALQVVINAFNYNRKKYLETKDKTYWWQMIQLLPSSYNQKRTVQLNYAVLKNIYHARKHHKLDEWHRLCEIIETLPHSELITG